MKILSKFKDYYDFLQGIYGIDEKVVYDRTVEMNLPPIYVSTPRQTFWSKHGFLDVSILSICDEFYFAIKWQDRIITNEQEIVNVLNNDFEIPIHGIKKLKVEHLQQVFLPRQTIDKLNSPYNIPIIGIKAFNFYRNNSVNPNLQEDFSWIKSLLPPREIYLKLSSFLSKKDIDLVNKPDDMSRFEAKGFDKKSSFRTNK